MSSQPPTSDDPSDGPSADVGDEPVPEDGAAPAEETTVETAPDGVVAPWRVHAGRVWHYARWPAFAAGGLVALLVLVGAWLWFTTDLPAVAGVGASAVLVDRNGDELAVLGQDGLRLEVPLDEMGPHVADAVVAAEDRRFRSHDGVDPLGIVRAVWNNVNDDDTEGGSTITQQLVKNLYLDSDRTFTRKVREAVLAVKVEQQSSKDEILEQYLNTVYFGRGAYGVEAAARTYFDTSATELRLAQSALLVGILRAPESLDPADEPEAAKERRDAVLAAMEEMGTATSEEAEAARAEPVEALAEASPTRLTAGVAPHFVEKVRRDIVEQFGERALYDRGLVIHTTLDIADQRAAEASVAAHLDDPGDPQAAVVGIDRSGAVRAWVGGRDFEELKVDLVTGSGSGRQPGSTFKPVVLAASFEAGLGAGQRFDAPSEITLDIPPEPWTVSNAGGAAYGSLTLLDATVKSVNTVYAQALAQIGPEAVVDVARRLGVDRELDAHPSIALGAEEVSPLELATVFSTLSRSGQRIDPFAVSKVENRDGDVIWERDEPSADEAIAPRIADTVSAVLSETPRRGTARRAALDRPMAAKTGTTQDNADAWLAGYTPEYTAVVWLGYADSNEPIKPIDGEAVQGGSVPAEIWHDFMVEALADVEPTEFPEPDEELLGDTTDDLRLAVSPGRVEPGERIAMSGRGFEVCVNGWQVVLEGQGLRMESPPDGGSTDSDRSASLRLPPEAAPGNYRVFAQCDFGSGLRPYGPAASLVVGRQRTTTSTTSSSTSSTSSSSTSSTTTTTEPDSTTTTTDGSTTTSSSSSSTTTTEGGKEKSTDESTATATDSSTTTTSASGG